MITVSVVIPNWNGSKYIKPCLDSLANQSYKDFEVIFVDNASTDVSLKIVSEYKWIKVVRNNRNLGFAGGCNRGAKEAAGEFIFFLNVDTICEPNCCLEIFRAIKSNKKTGMVATKMLSYDNKNLIDCAGHVLLNNGSIEKRGAFEESLEYNEDRNIFGPSAGAGLYRVETLIEVGVFDEDLFAYIEDVDLNWRIILAGWQCKFASKAIVYHKGSYTSKDGIIISEKVRHLILRNKTLVFIKCVPLDFMLKNMFWIYLYFLVCVAQNILKGNIFRYIYAKFSALRDLPKTLGKRRDVQRLRKIQLNYIAEFTQNFIPFVIYRFLKWREVKSKLMLQDK